MNLKITAKKRDKKQNEDLRLQGFVPGVIYGPDRKPENIYVNALDLEKLFQQAGESTLIDFELENEKPVKVLIQNLQKDRIKNKIIHVDFKQINMNKKIHANVELKFTNQAPAVKELGGILHTNLEQIEIKCLPNDLINHIDVDLSHLKTFSDAIYVKDLNLGTNIEILTNPETIIAKVSQPLTEEQLKAKEEKEPQSVDEVKVENEDKKETEQKTDK